MVIQPIDTKERKYGGTRILKYKQQIEEVKDRTHKIIERSCRFYGSSYHFKKEDTIRIT